jgi:ABC-2 type transport system permease protein
MVLALLYGLALAVAVVASLIALRDVDVVTARSIIVVCGTAVVLAYLLLPLAFGVDDQMDPRRFALFGIPPMRLSADLLAAAFVSVPALAITVAALTQVYTWSRSPAATLIALVSAVLLVALCVLGARVTSAIAAFMLSSRMARDVTGFVVVVAFVALAPVFLYFSIVDWSHNGLDVLARIAGFTPFGAAWAAPGDAAAGAFDLVGIKLLIAAASVVLLWFSWNALVARMLVAPTRQIAPRSVNELGWFARIGTTPFGVIAARSLTYWARDARYRTSLWVVPFVPLLPVIALAIAGVGVPVLGLLPVPIWCLFLAWSTLHNDLAYDDTAVWLHVATGTRGRDDRWGRAFPVLLIGVPLVVLGSLASTALWGDWRWFPSILGFNACLLLAGVGLSSVLSVSFPYPAVKPGDSPFAQPQAPGSSSSLIQSLSFFGVVALALPVAGLAAFAVVNGPRWHELALVVGLVIGVGVLLLGIRWGGAIFDRRAPELLEFAEQN